jgi:hypothetical protein
MKPMDVLKEWSSISDEYIAKTFESLHKDERKRIGAILRILEIGDMSIAHAVALLHICEDVMLKCSPVNMKD